MEQKQKHQVHNLIILDESGSMESIKDTIISGFNEIVQTVKGVQAQFPEQEHFISLITFNGLGQKVLHFIDPVSQLNCIDRQNYQPSSLTPLYDAMGFGFAKMRQVVDNQPNAHVLVTILTDGEENASKEYSGSTIKKMVEELKSKRWTFTYIGTDHDVEKFAAALSINNTLAFKKSESGMQDMFSRERGARVAYGERMNKNENLSDNFYQKGEGEGDRSIVPQ
jgi:Mg-chelatase subunit ChlD